MVSIDAIEYDAQLLVEGNDQRNFFRAMLRHMNLGGVQIHNFGGVDELRAYAANLADSDEFSQIVKSVGIVRDAEGSAESAFRSVQGALRNAGMNVPNAPGVKTDGSPSVSVFILPDNESGGMLETLLCRTFEDTPMNGCIDGFFDCVSGETGERPHRPEKSRAHAYIATTPEPQVSVGVAAQRGYWNLDHAAFGGVRRFLQSLRPTGENPSP